MAHARSPVQDRLAGGAAVALLIVIPIEHHTLTPTTKPFKHPGAMVTPYPDLRHYTTRDYGNRIGAFRILKALKTAGLKAVFPFNALALNRLAPLVDAIIADGHEIAACGLSPDHIHWGGLDSAVEADWIAETRARFDAAGLKPRAWMSPARQQSFATLDLVAAEGFDICLDWEHDTAPTRLKTKSGDVYALPLSNELDDRVLMIERRQSEQEWATQILDAEACLAAEHDRAGGQVLGVGLTPYICGQPFRVAALRRLLGDLSTRPDAWTASAAEIVTAAQSQI
ncbi:MAG: polysaccharide deacetylase [Alphaproteobacteria bacterium]